jgi:hypothetical protein
MIENLLSSLITKTMIKNETRLKRNEIYSTKIQKFCIPLPIPAIVEVQTLSIPPIGLSI